MSNPFLQFVEKKDEENPFLQFAEQPEEPEQPALAPIAEPAPAVAPVPEEAASTFGADFASGMRDFARAASYMPGGIGVAGKAVSGENPFAQYLPGAPATTPEEEGSFWGEVKKGLGSAWEGIKFLPESIGLQTNAETVDMRRGLQGAYDAIDEGKKFTPAEASRLRLDYAMLRNYQKATPEKREEIKAANASFAQEKSEKILAALPAFAEYQKRLEPYQARVEGVTDVRSLNDFKDWLGFNVASGAVQLIPIMASAYVAGPGGAFAVGSSMALQEGVQNRLDFILDKVKNLSPEDQAEAVQEYVAASGDTTMGVALVSGLLDLAGPVGTILRKQLGKELGQEAIKYETKTEAAKAALKEAPRELREEGLTGGAQEIAQITGERILGEQVGDIFTKDNITRVIDAAAAEAAGSIAGSGVNVTTAVGQQMVQQKAEEIIKQRLEDQMRDMQRRTRQADVAAAAQELGPAFDALVAQFRAEGMSEIESIKAAGAELASGRVGIGRTETDAGRDESSLQTPSGAPTGTTTTQPTETRDGTVAVPSDTVSDTREGEGAAPTSVDQLYRDLPPEIAEAIVERANEMVDDARMQGADIPFTTALAQARTAVVEELFGGFDSDGVSTQTGYADVVRYDEEGAQPSFDKPHGIYTTPANVDSPHKDVGPKVSRWKLNPAANVLDISVEDGKNLAMRQGAVGAGAGVAATRQLLGADTFNAIKGLSKQDLIAWIGANTNLDSKMFEGYYDAQEVMEGLGGMLAREAGYDAIAYRDRTPLFADPRFDEHVLLTENSVISTEPQAQAVPLDQVTDTTQASELPTNPETGLKPKGKRGRKPVERTPEQQAAAEQQRKDRQKVGRDSIRTAERARAVVEKPFNVDDYDNMDAARAAATELQQERDAALLEAYRILNDKNISPTAKAKQIAKTVIDHPSVDAAEKNRAQQRAKQAPTTAARSGFLADSTNSQPDSFYEGATDATQALDHIIKTGNPFERLLAQRIKPFLKGVKIVIVNDPNTDIPDAKTRANFKGAMGLYAEKGKQRTIYLSNLPGLRGINNMTLLHEAVHGATMAQINAWIKDPNSVSPQVRAAVESLQGVMLQAYKYYAVLNVAGKTDPLEDALFGLDAFTDLKEFVAYGLTQPEMQDFLMKVPGRLKFNDQNLNRGMLTKFVQSIRQMFNMGAQYDSAFQDLVVVTDRLLSAGPAPTSKNTIMALAKKLTAQNKTLSKLAKSRTATALNASVGELMMQTRNGKDALRLLRSVYDALNVRSIRLVLPTMTTMDITRWAGDRIVNLAQVNDAVQQMAGMRSKMIRELAQKVPDWVNFGQKYEKGAQTLGDVMHASTLLGVDPTAYNDLADAMQNDAQLQQLRADYQTALQDPAKSAKERATAKGNVTKRENELKAVYQGGTVVNPHTNERYTIEGWDQLGKYGKGEGQRIYRMAKEAYQDTFALHQKLLVDKITKSSIPGAANQPNTPKGQLIAQITQTFQEAQQLGVYFPLMRYGNHWLRIGKGKGGEFYMFESATARNNFARKRAEESGKTLDDMIESQDFDVGDDLQTIRNDVAESSQMLKDIFKSLDDNTQVDPATGRPAITDVDAIKDQVYQMFLMTLPDRDMRRRFTHRQGKTGFSADVLRNFIVAQHTAANQLARLAYADKIRLGIASSYAELAGNPDKLKLGAFVDEVATRADAEMSPNAPDEFGWDKLAAVGNQVVFYYMLTAPKSALVQMTQLPIVGLPVLTAEYGAAETAKVTARYSNLFNKLGTSKRDANGDVITIWGEPTIRDSSYVHKHPDPEYRKALKRAWEAAQDRDIFMSTYAADMTSRAKAPTGEYQGWIKKGTRATLNFMGGAFHHLERLTREIMYMSTFELEYARAKKEGLDSAAATNRGIEAGTKMVYEALFNYTQYNKPRLMKAPLPRIATQFMTYPLQMTSYLVRNFYSMIPYLNKEGKRDAAVKFFGTLGMTGMFAGVVGLPGYSAIMGVAEGVREMLRPDMEGEEADEYYDEDDDGNPLGKRNLDLWFREWFIPTYFGPDSSLANAMGLSEEQALLLQRSVKMGPISALTDMNIGASTTLDGLWFRDDTPAQSSKTAFQEMVFNAATGPFGSMASSAADAFDDFNNGDFNRGVEKILPAFVRGAAKAARQKSDGELTRQGAELRNAEWFTTGKLIGQSLGFQSTEIAEVQKKNMLAKRMVIQIQKDRQKVLESLDKAVQRFENDPSDANEERIDKALVAIDRYNYKNGMLAINGDTISKSLQGRAKRRMEAIEGLSVSPKEAPFVYPLLEKSQVPQE